MVNNYEHIEKKAVEKAERRVQKKRPRMKVSGKSVFTLQGKLFKSALRAKKKK